MEKNAVDVLESIVNSLEYFSLLNGESIIAYLQTAGGLSSIVNEPLRIRSPNILIRDDGKVHLVTQTILNDLIDELALASKLQAGHELRERLLSLVADLTAIDGMCGQILKSKQSLNGDSKPFWSVSDELGEGWSVSIAECQCSAESLALFVRKLISRANVVERVLTDNDAGILEAMLAMNATSDSPSSAKVILSQAKWTSGGKRAFNRLKEYGYVASKKGVGYYLTEKGVERAKRLGART